MLRGTNRILRLSLGLLALASVSVAGAASAQPIACPVDVVFTVDTSGSMDDEAAALCAAISTVESDLIALGIDANVTLWGITANPGGAFSCLTGNVASNLTSVVPGNNGACGTTLNGSESWGEAVSVVSANFPWTPGAVRLVVPISDEGACDGDSCADPGEDRDAINNAIINAVANDVIASPISGTGSSACVQTLGQDLAAGTGGTWAASTDPNLDLAQLLFDIAVQACVSALQCRVDPELDFNVIGDLHTATVTIQDFVPEQGFVPVPGRPAAVVVTNGPNLGEFNAGATNAAGQVSHTYVGDGGPGIDTIVGVCFDAENQPQLSSNTGRKVWDFDCQDNGIPDTCDVDCGGFGGLCEQFANSNEEGGPLTGSGMSCGMSLDLNENGIPDECDCPCFTLADLQIAPPTQCLNRFPFNLGEETAVWALPGNANNYFADAWTNGVWGWCRYGIASAANTNVYQLISPADAMACGDLIIQYTNSFGLTCLP